MIRKRTNGALTVAGALALFATGISPVRAEQPTTDYKRDKSNTEYKRDNTAVNERDREASRLTADNQSMSKSDTDLTAQIRKSFVADDTLSTYAQNVKIISENGIVTLRGPVRSVEERTALQNKASAIAGAQNVKNEIEIAAKSQS